MTIPPPAAQTPTPAQRRPAPSRDGFIEFVRSLAKDTGNRARLRRSLSGSTITDDAWWMLGRWLPADSDNALVMARVAGWCATYHNGSAQRWHTIAGELRRSVNEDVARRTLEGVTREGAPAALRTSHITRVLAMCSNPQSIDWAQMITDLIGLNRGGEWAHDVRSRWYREYFNSPDASQQRPANEQAVAGEPAR